MKRWNWMMAQGLFLIMLLVACQAATRSEAGGQKSEDRDQKSEVSKGKSEDQKKKPNVPPVPKAEKKPAALPVPGTEDVIIKNAFPPTISDVEYHQNAWLKNDCLRCHETGVENATLVRHEGMPDILLTAMCRSCHVLIPGQAPLEPPPVEDSPFASNAFPPMIPASESHQEAWYKDNCLLCHEAPGVRGAPLVQHRDLPRLLLRAKCRSCHVQVRSSSIPGW